MVGVFVRSTIDIVGFAKLEGHRQGYLFTGQQTHRTTILFASLVLQLSYIKQTILRIRFGWVPNDDRNDGLLGALKAYVDCLSSLTLVYRHLRSTCMSLKPES